MGPRKTDFAFRSPRARVAIVAAFGHGGNKAAIGMLYDVGIRRTGPCPPRCDEKKLPPGGGSLSCTETGARGSAARAGSA